MTPLQKEAAMTAPPAHPKPEKIEKQDDRPSGDRIPWYLETLWVWVWLLSFGPLALPLLFRSPRFGRGAKIGITLAVAVLTYYSIDALIRAIHLLRHPGELRDLVAPWLSVEQLELFDFLSGRSSF
jgi:hypothetical protein